MTDQSDMDTFESIVSGAPATDGDAAATTISDASQPRSDDGRFTKPQEKPAASDPAPQPGAIDQPAANGGVPVRAVQDEREKRQEASPFCRVR
jgi:hypothetical protein